MIKRFWKTFLLAGILVLQFLLVGYNTDDPEQPLPVDIVEEDMEEDTEEGELEEEPVIHTGWYQDEGLDWFYYDQNGEMLTGWQFVKGYWYYLDAENTDKPGVMISDGRKEIEGETYFFNADGAMFRGWIERPEGWYFTNNSGAMVTGWVQSKGIWYYLDGENEEYPGLMVYDCYQVIEDREYLFYESGAMHTGWLKLGEDWKYYNVNGHLCSGWVAVNGYWYYLDPENDDKMFGGGWKLINEKWYYFYASGAMDTGWLQRPEGWYYMGADGAMKTGWQLIENRWYYFYYKNDVNGGSEGVMAHSRTIGGWYLSTTGTMVSEEELPMTMAAQQYSSNTMYMILVDLSRCRVGVFKGSLGNWSITQFWACSPGKASTPTVRGQFTVGSKGYYFDSGASRCFWYTQFYNDYLFHSVLYNKNGTLQDGRLGMHLSHGCVRMEISAAKWIYDNIPRGTKVVVY